jgi:hypothetical protein
MRLSRRNLFCAVLVAALCTLSVAPALSEEMATLFGGIVDPEGQSAVGFRVVVKNVATERLYTSAPSNSKGEYAVTIPVGSQYQIDSVLAPDGASLKIQQSAPVTIQTSGNVRLDIQFEQRQDSAPAAKPVEPSATTTTAQKTPWYKKKGGIIGIVIASGAVVGAALAHDSGGGDGPNTIKATSPSSP